MLALDARARSAGVARVRVRQPRLLPQRPRDAPECHRRRAWRARRRGTGGGLQGAPAMVHHAARAAGRRQVRGVLRHARRPADGRRQVRRLHRARPRPQGRVEPRDARGEQHIRQAARGHRAAWHLPPARRGGHGGVPEGRVQGRRARQRLRQPPRPPRLW